MAAELNPPVGEPCTTPGEVIPLGGPGVDLQAVCRLVEGQLEGERLYYRLETARVLPHAALLSGHRCYSPETPNRDDWLTTKLIFTCMPFDPGKPGPGVRQTSEGTPEASASTPDLFFIDVYREALGEPLGRECSTPGEVLSRFDAGSREILVACRDEVAGRSFYQLESLPPRHTEPEGHQCSVIGNKSTASLTAVEGDTRHLFCAEIEPGVGVIQRITWSPDPLGVDGPCESGAPDWYAEEDGLRLRISCRPLMGAPTWAVVEANPVGGLTPQVGSGERGKQ